MTPQQLHAIYAPAWSARPECRPPLIYNEWKPLGPAHSLTTGKHWVHDNRDIHDDLAAALCFEAAWVWHARKTHASPALAQPGKDTWIGVGNPDFPTHHHAIVAAVVQAVGEGKHAREDHG